MRDGGVDRRGARAGMKIATFNVNDVNKRLANLLAWLAEAEPRHRLPAGAQGRPGPLPRGGAAQSRLRRGVARSAQLDRRRHPRQGHDARS